MIAQQLLNGVISGAVYALFALGFTLVFGTHRILNLAHGGVFMAGAFVGYYATTVGLPFWAATLLAMASAGAISYAIDLIAFRQLRRSGHIEYAAIISSIGANLILVDIAQRLSATKVLSFPFEVFPISFYRILGLRISSLQVVILLLVAVILAGLAFYLYRTSFGRQVRAVAGNERTAMLLGVNPAKVYFQTFFISGALAGLAGVLIGLLFNSIHFLMGEQYLLRGFVIVIIGGLGSIPGAVVAGLMFGVVQTCASAYLPSGLSDAIINSILFLVLMLIPNGIFGKHVAQTVAERR